VSQEGTCGQSDVGWGLDSQSYHSASVISQWCSREVRQAALTAALCVSLEPVSCASGQTPRARGTRTVQRGSRAGHPLDLQPHSMQPVEFGIDPRNQLQGEEYEKWEVATMLMAGTMLNLSYHAPSFCKDVCPFLCKTRSQAPPAPLRLLFRCQAGHWVLLVASLAYQTRSHPKIGECVIGRQACQWRPVGRVTHEVETVGNRLHALDPHSGPHTKVCHCLQKM
jgi:hypothetical protein